MAKAAAKSAKTPRTPPPRLRREDAYFGLHFDLHSGSGDTELGARVTDAMVEKILRATRPDFLQYDCKGHAGFLGYPHSKVSESAGGPGSKGIVNDSLAIYRRVTAAHGVALLMHFSGVWDNVACRDHPEWASINSEGKVDAAYTSTFSPYVTERMIPQMKEIIDRYDVDGFWVDGDCWGTQVDYCEKAKARFKEATGQETPPTKPEEPFWFEWMTIQRDQFFQYARTYMDAVHAYRPSVQIASNWLYSPLAPEPVKMKVDFVSGDFSHSDSVNSARFNGRQLASTGMPWDLIAWAFSIAAHTGAFIYKPVQQLQQEAASVLALGGGFNLYFSPDRHGGFPQWQIEAMGQVAQFCRERQAVCHKSQPVPQVALLLDTNTVFRISSRVYSPYSGEYDALQGMLHAMLEGGHSVDVVCDHQLHGQLDCWPVIVVPEWRLLGAGLVQELAEYAQRGGSLLITGAQACGLFREHLGVEFVGEAKEQMPHLQVDRRSTGDLPWAAPSKGLWQDVKVTATGKNRPTVVAHRTTGRHDEVGSSVAATLTKVGRGKIIAVYGPLGAVNWMQHAPAVRDFVAGLLSKLYTPKVTIDYHDGPRCIDLAVREKEGRLIAHLNNVTGMATEYDRYQLVDRIPATGPVTLSIRCAVRPRRVTLEPAGKRLPVVWSKGVLTVKAPGVHIHTAVVVE